MSRSDGRLGPGGQWDDDRIREAYGELTATAKPEDLESATLQAVRSAATKPAAGWRPRFRRVWLPFGGLAAAAAVVALVGVGLSMRAGPGRHATATPLKSVSPWAGPTHTPVSELPGTDRYPSGIPATIDGQHIYVGQAAADHATHTTDSTPFLVGMWSNEGSGVCLGGGTGLDKGLNALTASDLCPPGLGGSDPATFGDPALVASLRWLFQTASPKGPLVLRVHTHDQAASECLPQDKSICDAAMVVDDVVWNGDSWTQTDPVSVAQAVLRLTSLRIGPRGSPYQMLYPLYVVGHPTVCPSPWPHEVFDVRGDSRIGLLAVFPDVASREAAQAALDPASPGCVPDPSTPRPRPAHWVGVENMLALVYGDATVVNATTAALTTPPELPLSTAKLLPASPSPSQSSSAGPSPLTDRYPSGIPATIDGQPVYVGQAAAEYASQTTDDTPFLVGMWSYNADADRDGIYCVGGPLSGPDKALNTLTYSGPCSTGVGGADPTAYSVSAVYATLGWSAKSTPTGPVVLRVHTHDSLAAQCTSADTSTCQMAMVWRGFEARGYAAIAERL